MRHLSGVVGSVAGSPLLKPGRWGISDHDLPTRDWLTEMCYICGLVCTLYHAWHGNCLLWSMEYVTFSRK
jgi:hypothetical protein